MILNYPGNPDGCSYDEAELKALAEVAREHELGRLRGGVVDGRVG